jgi:hypothetical protein
LLAAVRLALPSLATLSKQLLRAFTTRRLSIYSVYHNYKNIQFCELLIVIYHASCTPRHEAESGRIDASRDRGLFDYRLPGSVKRRPAVSSRLIPRQARAINAPFEAHLELATAIDEMAERIRALGLPVPGSYKAYAELTSIDEGTGVPTADLPTQRMQVHEKDG